MREMRPSWTPRALGRAARPESVRCTSGLGLLGALLPEAGGVLLLTGQQTHQPLPAALGLAPDPECDPHGEAGTASPAEWPAIARTCSKAGHWGTGRVRPTKLTNPLTSLSLMLARSGAPCPPLATPVAPSSSGKNILATQQRAAVDFGPARSGRATTPARFALSAPLLLLLAWWGPQLPVAKAACLTGVSCSTSGSAFDCGSSLTISGEQYCCCSAAGVYCTSAADCPAPPSEDYDWDAGSWGNCSASCGGGVQTRSVTCKSSSGAVASVSNCSGSKPASTRSCNSGVLGLLLAGRTGAPAPGAVAAVTRRAPCNARLTTLAPWWTTAIALGMNLPPRRPATRRRAPLRRYDARLQYLGRWSGRDTRGCVVLVRRWRSHDYALTHGLAVLYAARLRAQAIGRRFGGIKHATRAVIKVSQASGAPSSTVTTGPFAAAAAAALSMLLLRA
eukprot:scaffold1075_cov197-Prasinococcus_capsulatus_cf.AAC.2